MKTLTQFINESAEDLAYSSFHALLKHHFPRGVHGTHEGPPGIEDSVRKHGLGDEHTGNFFAIGANSDFRNGKKVRVHFTIPHSHSRHIVPDMMYEPESPHQSLLKTHGGVHGAYAHYPEKIPPHWIHKIETIE